MAHNTEKPGMMLYFDVIGPLAKHLEDNEFGELIRHAVEYSMTGAEPDIDVFSPVSMAWDILMPHLDRDTARYRSKQEAARYANYCKSQKQQGYTPLSMETWLSTL